MRIIKNCISIISILFAFPVCSQHSIAGPELSADYLRINDLIFIDTKKAKQEIDSLKILFRKNGNVHGNQELHLIEIEYYRSLGDFSHMKHLLYKELEKVNKNTPNRIRLGLNYFRASNYGFEMKFNKFLPLVYSVLKEARSNNYKFLEAQCLTLYGNYYSRKGNYKKSQEYYIKASSIYLSMGSNHLNTMIEMKRGITYSYEGNSDLALAFLHKGLLYCKAHKLIKTYCQHLSYIAEEHLYFKDLDSSIIYYGEFLKLKDQADIRDVYEAYRGLEYYYYRIHNIDSAYHYAKMTSDVDEFIKSNMDKELGDEFEVQYNEKAQKKLISDKEDEIKKEKSRNHVQLLVFIMVGLLFLLFLIVFWMSNRHKNKLNQHLSEQKEAIAQKNKIIDAALKDKEVLLKEIHHRVKNNLQVISSLLNLQSNSIDDVKAKQVLNDGKERIQAIALIHHRLYQNEVFSYISMDDYLPDLINQLLRTYSSSDKELLTSIEANDIRLSMDTAVPVGLIICEIVTNALKHAFEGKHSGFISVILKSTDQEGFYSLEIEDDGIGIKEGMNFPFEGSMGAEIITALSEQLNGKLDVTTSSYGTKFLLIFQDIQIVN